MSVSQFTQFYLKLPRCSAPTKLNNVNLTFVFRYFQNLKKYRKDVIIIFFKRTQRQHQSAGNISARVQSGENIC